MWSNALVSRMRHSTFFLTRFTHFSTFHSQTNLCLIIFWFSRITCPFNVRHKRLIMTLKHNIARNTFENRYFQHSNFYFRLIGCWLQRPSKERLPILCIHLTMTALALTSLVRNNLYFCIWRHEVHFWIFSQVNKLRRIQDNIDQLLALLPCYIVQLQAFTFQLYMLYNWRHVCRRCKEHIFLQWIFFFFFCERWKWHLQK